MNIIKIVAMQEDACRYSRPVDFWNSQLQGIGGFASWQSFDRARKKAVQSGWLRYTPGKKGKPGIYQAVIPPELAGVADTPIAEEIALESTNESEVNAEGNGQSSSASAVETGGETGLSSHETEAQAGGKREESGDHPTLPLSLPLKKERGRFRKPTVKDVVAFCEHRRTEGHANRIDPQQFIDFYESKGWKVGNQPMKDWMAAVRNWERRDAQRHGRKAMIAAPWKNLRPGTSSWTVLKNWRT